MQDETVPSSSPKSVKFLRRLILGVVAANLLIAGLLAMVSYKEYRHLQDQAAVNATNLVMALEKDLRDLFDKIDITLFAISREAQGPMSHSKPDSEGLNTIIGDFMTQTEIGYLRIADQNGFVIAAPGAKQNPATNIADRHYFAKLQQGDKGPIFEGPLVSRINNKPALIIARSIPRSNGQFGGIAYAVIPTASITEFFSRIDLGPNGGISLRGTDMSIIVRHPDPNGTFQGNRVVSPELRALLDRGLTSGTYFSGTTWDGVSRQVAFTKLGPYPFFLNVGLAPKDYLSPWLADLWRLGATFALFATLSGIWVVSQIRAWHRGQAEAERIRLHLEDKVRERTEALQAANAQLEELSHVDQLTGLSNRRHLDKVLDQEWRRSLRHRQPLSCIMVDADEFKPFNDNYGHVAGDDCLRAIAQVLKDHAARAGDLPARFGGEEFLVLLPLAEPDVALDHAESIRLAIMDLNIHHGFSSTGLVTISLGVATIWPDEENDAETLIRKADTALYEAKRQGRNRTVQHQG